MQSIRTEYYNALVGDIGIVYQNITIIWNICHRYGGHPHSTVDISLATIAYHFFDLVYSAEYQHAGRRQRNEHPSSPDKQLTKRMHSIIPHFHPLPHHFHHKSTPTSTNTSQLPNRTQQPTANPQQATTAIISGDQKQNTQSQPPATIPPLNKHHNPPCPSSPTRPHQHDRQYQPLLWEMETSQLASPQHHASWRGVQLLTVLRTL